MRRGFRAKEMIKMVRCVDLVDKEMGSNIVRIVEVGIVDRPTHWIPIRCGCIFTCNRNDQDSGVGMNQLIYN